MMYHLPISLMQDSLGRALNSPSAISHGAESGKRIKVFCRQMAVSLCWARITQAFHMQRSPAFKMLGVIEQQLMAGLVGELKAGKFSQISDLNTWKTKKGKQNNWMERMADRRCPYHENIFANIIRLVAIQKTWQDEKLDKIYVRS